MLFYIENRLAVIAPAFKDNRRSELSLTPIIFCDTREKNRYACKYCVGLRNMFLRAGSVTRHCIVSESLIFLYNSAVLTYQRFIRQAIVWKTAMQLPTLIPTFLLFIIGTCIAESIPQIPSYLKVCHQSDPKLDECVADSITAMQPYVKAGTPELNIPPSDPMVLSDMDLKFFGGPLALTLNLTNIQAYGVPDYKVVRVRVNLDKDRMFIQQFIPWLNATADYTMTGKMLMLMISGHGKFSGKVANATISTRINCTRYVSDKTGMMHFRVEDIKSKLQIDRFFIHLDNFFGTDKALSDAMNLLLNDNWPIFYSEIQSSIENLMANKIGDTTSKVFEKYPLEMLLPP